MKDFFGALLTAFREFFWSYPVYPQAAELHFTYLKFAAIILAVIAGVVVARKLGQRRYRNWLSRSSFSIAAALFVVAIPAYLEMYNTIPTPEWWQKLILYALFFYLNAFPIFALTLLAIMPGGVWDRIMAWRAKAPAQTASGGKRRPARKSGGKGNKKKSRKKKTRAGRKSRR